MLWLIVTVVVVVLSFCSRIVNRKAPCLGQGLDQAGKRCTERLNRLMDKADNADLAFSSRISLRRVNTANVLRRGPLDHGKPADVSQVADAAAVHADGAMVHADVAAVHVDTLDGAGEERCSGRSTAAIVLLSAQVEHLTREMERRFEAIEGNGRSVTTPSNVKLCD